MVPNDGFSKMSVLSFSAILALFFVQIILGAFTAGLHAGLLYPTFPLMGGHVLPPETFHFIGSPWDNATLIQFLHRYTAKILVISLGFWWFFHRKSIKASPARNWWTVLVLVLLAQFALGVLTLVNGVPLVLALKHQLVGLGLFGVSIMWFHALRREST